MSEKPIQNEELRKVVLEILSRIAPEADLARLPPDANLREELELDSMDVLNLMISLHERMHVDIPEQDYAKMTTLQECVDYLAEPRF